MTFRFSIPSKIKNFTNGIASDNYFTLKIFLIGLCLRVIFTLLHPSVYPVTDMLGYNEAANSLLLDGEIRVKGILAASRPPVYPYFLYAIYWIFGHSFLIVRLMQAVLGALTAVILVKIGSEMFDNRVGALSGLIYALYPASWAFGDQLMTETLFTLLMLSSVLLMIKMMSSRNYWIIFGAGFFGGLAILCRTAYAPFMMFIFLGILIFRFKSPKYISRFFMTMVICGMVIFPWMLRNYYTHGIFTLNPKSGVDFAMYNSSSLPFIIANQVDDKQFLAEHETWRLDEITKSKLAVDVSKKWFKNNPQLFLVKGVRQFMNIWGFDRDYFWCYIAGYYGEDPVWLLLLMLPLMGIPFVLFAPLSITGFTISKPFSDKLIIPTLVMICLHVVSFIVYGFSRHRFPFVAFIIVWAVYTVLNWNEVVDIFRSKAKRGKRWIIISAWAFLIFSWGVEIFVDIGQFLGLQFVE